MRGIPAQFDPILIVALADKAPNTEDTCRSTDCTSKIISRLLKDPFEQTLWIRRMEQTISLENSATEPFRQRKRFNRAMTTEEQMSFGA